MAEVKLPAGIASISGKMGNVCFRTMKATGKVYMMSMPQARKTPYRAKEKAAMESFGKRAKIVAAIRREGSRKSQKELWKLASQAL